MADESGYTPAPTPDDEAERLEQLRLLGLLDTGNEDRFDRFTQLVADLFKVPIALITLVDANRQWFKSSCGLGVSETPRDISFCGHAILEPDLMVIPDAREDQRFEANPLVTGPPHIRFYAGAVLRSKEGRALGTLCLIDHKPRSFPEDDRRRLLAIASMVEAEMRHECEFQLQRQEAFENAHFDAVTRLPNARLFKDRLEQALTHSRRSGERMLIGLVEARGIVDVRTALGAEVADDLMRLCAQRLSSSLNENCTLARWGDDIFGLLLPSLVHDDEPEAFLEHLQKVMSENFMVQGNSLHIEVTSGAAIYPEDGVAVDNLIQHASIALRDANTDSHINWRLYSSEMSSAMVRRVHLEHHLREAVNKKQLSVVYQPRIDLDSNEIHRVEALCRWNTPGMNAISPEEFIPLAETSNLIIEIDRYVIARAVKKLLEWDRTGVRPLALSVNLSSKTLMHPQLIPWLKEMVLEAGIDPARVVLEVTENSLVADLGLARQNTARCRDLGFSVAIDDFGTGFSSFNYLKDLAVDELKLDRVFVREMTQRRRDASIANSIIALARDLGLTVVAEGVEIYNQVVYLNAYHCDEAQGYYFSPPVEPDELFVLLERSDKERKRL